METPPAIEFRSEAAAEALAAWQWYNQRSQTAADRFTQEINDAVNQIITSPNRWPTHHRGTRRYRLHRFPYSLVYRIKDNCIQVIACQHGHQKPAYWRDRLNP